jgi:hypothetical protein
MTFYRTGSIRGCCIHWGPWWRWSLSGACFWEHWKPCQGEGLFTGNGSIFHEVLLIYKMAALLFYHSPIFL